MLTYSFYTKLPKQLFLVVVINSSILQFFNHQVFVFEINMPEGTEIALLANIMTSSFSRNVILKSKIVSESRWRTRNTQQRLIYSALS